MDYKVKVNNEAESKEVQELFFELGCDFYFGGKLYCNTHLGIVTANKDGLMANIELDGFEYKELTIQQLKDMVVLKRNSVSDRNVIDPEYTANLYLNSKGELFVFHVPTQSWKISNLNGEEEVMQRLKPIEESEMKEFLVNYDNKWTLRLLDSDTEENHYRVAVPSGADVAYFFNASDLRNDEDDIVFYKNSLNFIFQHDGYWEVNTGDVEFIKNKGCIIWQRLGLESLNDQYAENEKVRQEAVKATIDGVEAFNAIANDIDVQYRFAGGKWKDYTQDLNRDGSKLKAVDFLCDHCEFRYKPKTIVVNGVEYEDEQKAVKVVQDYFKGYIK